MTLIDAAKLRAQVEAGRDRLYDVSVKAFDLGNPDLAASASSLSLNWVLKLLDAATTAAAEEDAAKLSQEEKDAIASAFWTADQEFWDEADAGYPAHRAKWASVFRKLGIKGLDETT